MDGPFSRQISYIEKSKSIDSRRIYIDMAVSLYKLKNIFHRIKEPVDQKIDHSYEVEKPRVRISPYIYPAEKIGTIGETLHFQFCSHCHNPIAKTELLAFKGTICLLSCKKVGCEKRLFRIDTIQNARGKTSTDPILFYTNTLLNHSKTRLLKT